MRVATYYRVSSGAQRDAHTIDSQRTAARALIEARGWTLVAEHADDGRSARTGLSKRTGFADLLDLARRREIDAVVTVAFDRLTRAEDLQEQGTILGKLQAAGVKIITSAGEETDLGTFSGRLVATLRAQLAAEESAVKSDRAKRGYARTVAAGRPPSAPPLGYRYDREVGAWREDASAATVREIYRRAAAGESASQIARTIRGDLPRGGRWSAAAVIRVLRTTAYDTGAWQLRAGVISVPSLVDADTAAIARQGVAAGRLRGLRRTRHVYLLEALARCTCGALVRIAGYVTHRGDRTYRYTYYACGAACGQRRQRTDAIDDAIWSEVSAWIAAPDLARAYLATIGAASTDDGRRALGDLDEWRRRLDAIPPLEVEALRLRERGALSAAALGARLAELSRRRDLLDAQIATATAATVDAASRARAAATVEATISTLRARADVATPEQRRELVRALAVDVTISDEGARIDLRLPVEAAAVRVS